MRGWVFTEQPIAGAKLTVYKAAKEKEPIQLNGIIETGEQGVFLIPAEELPTDFRIVASNGHLWGQKFDAELKADVHNFNPEADYVYINAVTTLICAYTDRHPEKTLDEVITLIKDFLEIPQVVDVGEVLHNSEEYFSHMMFMLEASEKGGLTKFTEILLDEIENYPGKTHPFFSYKSGYGAGFGDIVKEIGGKLLNGAISAAGSKGFGWLLSLTGADFFKTDTQWFKEIQQMLSEIKAMIAELQTEMYIMKDELIKEIRAANYNNLLNIHLPLITRVKDTLEDLSYLADTMVSAKEHKEYFDEESKRIKDIIGKQIKDQRSQLHMALVGAGGAEGLIKVWSRVVKSKHRFLGSDDSKKIQAQFEFFDAVQLSMILLIAEHDHTIRAPSEVVQKDFDLYLKNREAQLAIKPDIIPKGAIVEAKTELMIYPCDVWNEYKSISGMYPCYCTSADLHYWVSLPLSNRDSEVSYNVNYTPGWSMEDRSRPTSTGKPLLGFKNWRMPTREEGEMMFKGWTGKGLGTWAVSQGYPKDYINDDMKLYLFRSPAFKDSYILFTKNGNMKPNPLVIKSPYSPICLGERGGYLIPVRKTATGERYFW